MAETKQEQLDEAQGLLKRAISLADKVAKEADKEASEFCNAGDFNTAARLRQIAGDVRIGAGFLTNAYGKGRELEANFGGGIIQPKSGSS